jgi:subtilisin family serine protease
MKRKLWLSFVFFALMRIVAFAQVPDGCKKYWVFFDKKENVSFDAQSYFHPKAIERRVKCNLPLFTASDLPVSENYLAIIANNCTELKAVSRWFNAAIVFANEIQFSEIKKLPFVVELVESERKNVALAEVKSADASDLSAETALEKLAKSQLKRMGDSTLKANNLDGTGVIVAVFDAGFRDADSSPALKNLFDNKQIILTYDFVKNKEYVYSYHKHGTAVLSCIGGIYKDIPLGLATKAKFILARTETITEFYSEEENWVLAVEWADKNGADIISSSLGYTIQRYFRTQMNGKTSLVSRAANMAASKGMLVINSAGNDGDNKWHFLATPGDADSVLTVGGISPNTDYHINFSSFGPSYSGTLKPNVCAFGEATTATGIGVMKNAGTSFSCPLVAGFAACAIQANPNLSNMQIFHLLEKSAHLYPYYDYAHGYGVPQADKLLALTRNTDTLFTLTRNESALLLKFLDLEKIILKENVKYEGNNLLYYHLTKPFGTEITEFKVVSMTNNSFYSIDLENLSKGTKIRIHYKNQFEEYDYQ